MHPSASVKFSCFTRYLLWIKQQDMCFSARYCAVLEITGAATINFTECLVSYGWAWEKANYWDYLSSKHSETMFFLCVRFLCKYTCAAIKDQEVHLYYMQTIAYFLTMSFMSEFKVFKQYTLRVSENYTDKLKCTFDGYFTIARGHGKGFMKWQWSDTTDVGRSCDRP